MRKKQSPSRILAIIQLANLATQILYRKRLIFRYPLQHFSSTNFSKYYSEICFLNQVVWEKSYNL